MTKYPLLALAEPCPPGFVVRAELTRRDLRRTAFALFAPSVAAAEHALEPFRDKVLGLVVTETNEFHWTSLGRGLLHLGVPPALRPLLPELLWPHLDALQNVLHLSEVNQEQRLELERAAEDRARLVREFAGLRETLLGEIEDRRFAERELKDAHDQMEARVRERTEELAHERDRFNILMETVPDSIYFKDAQSRFIQVNRALVRLFDLRGPEDAVGKTDFDFFAPVHAEAAFADEQQIMRTGEAVVGKVEHEVLPDGRHKWALTTKMPLRDARGEIVGTFGVSRDITTIKQTEADLRTANARLGEVLSDLTRSHEALKGAQLQLIQAEKMQSVGLLAAGIAHEVKNPLAILNMGLGCLDDPASLPPEQCAMIVQEMREAVTRANSVISGLLDFSTAKELAIKPADLNAVVVNALHVVRHELARGGITVIHGFDPELPACPLDISTIEQVLVSLLTNAAHAMAQGGTLTVTTALKTLVADEVRQAPGDRSGSRFREGERVAFVRVQDTGPGIPADQLDKIFDPFFTTKPTGKGTGLGLTVARKIIELHGGQIDLANAPEGGARATLLLKL